MNDRPLEQPRDRRLIVLAICFTLGLGMITSKLIYYQVIRHKDLVEDVNARRFEEMPLPSRRGEIYDTNGELIATNGTMFEVSLTPQWASTPTVPQTIETYFGIPQQQTTDWLEAAKEHETRYILISRGVPQEIGVELIKLGLPGIQCEGEPTRVYPWTDISAHLVGFVNADGDGQYGLEQYYNGDLGGAEGRMQYERNASGYEIPASREVLVPPTDGRTLVLTVDSHIQYIAYQELKRALEKYRAESGTIMVMDPETGALLANVSYPSYDPNKYGYADTSHWSDPGVAAQWEPGSVLKIVTWSAGIDLKAITAQTTVFDPGTMTIGGQLIANSDHKSHGNVTMTDGLVHSLNTVAVYISTEIGEEKFYSYLQRFGFGSLTHIDLAGEVVGTIKMPGTEQWSRAELGTNSFGQGIAVTPIQMITAVGAVANDGVLMKPHVVGKIGEQGGDGYAEAQRVEPEAIRQAISLETAKIMTDMMVEVVEREVTEARVPGYRVAGKTGTAEIPTPNGYDKENTITSFVGFAPADDPKFVILVKLDRPKTSQWAGHTAAPAFQAVAERIIKYMHIPPDEIRLAQN